MVLADEIHYNSYAKMVLADEIWCISSAKGKKYIKKTEGISKPY